MLWKFEPVGFWAPRDISNEVCAPLPPLSKDPDVVTWSDSIL